ncbi:MAG TPA: hypothetical protein VIG80_03670 [Bacillaceae bacterium]
MWFEDDFNDDVLGAGRRRRRRRLICRCREIGGIGDRDDDHRCGDVRGDFDDHDGDVLGERDRRRRRNRDAFICFRLDRFGD